MEALESYERMRATPFLKWAGGKSRLLKQLDKRLPPKFGTYHEPFLGGGAFFFHLYSRGIIRKAMISDSNADLINAFVVIRDKLGNLLRGLAELQKHAKDEKYYYEVARKRFNDIGPLGKEVDVEKAALLIYLNKTCYNGLYRVNRNGMFNVPWGGYEKARLFDSRNLKAVSAVLNDENVVVKRADFDHVRSEARRGDFVYLDPPYQPISITSSFAEYTAKSFGMEDQERVASMFHELASKGCLLMLSNSPKVAFLYEGHGYNLETVKAGRAINCVGFKRGAVDELLVTSYSRAK
jgi:DNA adenine methylase